ncbi:class I SAM-dependent methyltransferase [Haloechinothrix halophila]|uniref:class I SAM-dependent methyltransferase n=1 Tax=Haloechinothrix halophila TaxID=1069073 RepID=UPI0004016577|nr:methyltransferase domain-containing protein [Haloechinothrix halophila]
MPDTFTAALLDHDCWLETAGGDQLPLRAQAWHHEPSAADEALLARCTGPTLDVGCGPGRLTSTLLRRGVLSVGIDSSPLAVTLTGLRGGIAIHGNVLGTVPGEGRWHHVLLADSNIGIGGDPEALLRRARRLVARHGTVLIEAGPPGLGLHREQVRIAGRHGDSAWFPWAWLGVDTLRALATRAGLTCAETWHRELRWFAELRPHSPR